MSDYIEFKAKLLNAIHLTWDEYYQRMDSDNPQSEFDFLNKMEKLFAIWEESKTVEAKVK